MKICFFKKNVTNQSDCVFLTTDFFYLKGMLIFLLTETTKKNYEENQTIIVVPGVYDISLRTGI